MVNLPACTETWHVTAFSCNDQRQREKTGTAAWAAMRILHERNPLHAVIGLGDQVRCPPPPLPRGHRSCARVCKSWQA